MHLIGSIMLEGMQFHCESTFSESINLLSLFCRLLFGLNNHTTAYQVMLAAYEAICFQTRDLLEAFIKDVPSWNPIERLTVGGEFSENAFLLQMLADLCGIRIERPQTSFPACLGAMIAAGLTMEVLHLEKSSAMFTPPIEIFQPTFCASSKCIKAPQALSKDQVQI